MPQFWQWTFGYAVAATLLHGSAALAQIEPAGDAPQPLSPAESVARIQLPSDLTIELVACEPLIQDPSCVAFDEFGRMFVTELHGYNIEGQLDVDQLNKSGQLDTQVRRLRWEFMGGEIAKKAQQLQFGVLKLLVDDDQDGRMDRAEVWADDLPPCYGVIPARGGVIVVCAPDIVFFADRDGDGRVDERETLFTGFDHTTMERGINNPIWGLDNWIYVGAGRHSGEIRGPHLAAPVTLGNEDFRMRADGTAIEPVSGSVSTFGLAMNDIGDRFPCSGGQPAVCAIPLPRQLLARNPLVETPAGNYRAASYGRGFRISAPHPWRVKRGQDPAWVRFYGARETNSSYFSGGCGGFVYRGGNLPDHYYGDFFYCEPSLNIIHRCKLERDGAAYRAQRAAGEENREFLASTDQWFRPMNLRIGPDGALYVVDMYREIIEDYSAIPRFLQQQYGLVHGADRGRIWRIVSADRSPSRTVVPDRWPAEFTTDELVAAAQSPNPWWRETAQRLLVDRGDANSGKALAAAVKTTSLSSARVQMLYTLQGLQALETPVIETALDDSDYIVRTHAVRLATPRLGQESALSSQVAAMTSDPDPRVRLEVALAMGEADSKVASPALLQLGLRHGSERWMPAAILSSAIELADQLLQEILAAPHPNQAEPLIESLAITVGAKGEPAAINGVLAVGAASETTRIKVARGLRRGDARLNVSGSPSAAEWSLLRRRVQESSGEEAMHLTHLACRLGLEQSPEVEEALSRASRRAKDNELADKDRQVAIELLSAASFDRLVRELQELVGASSPPVIRNAAIEAIGRSKSPQVATVLLQQWKSLTPDSRRSVLDVVMSRENRWPILIDALKQAHVRPADLTAVQREQLVRGRDQQVARDAQKLLETTNTAATSLDRLAAYQEALNAPRDIGQGEQVFAKLCLNCHRLKDRGHEVGPPLGSVIRKPDEVILRDILDPNAMVDPQFTNYIVVTRSGQTFSGILSTESATSVSLLKEKGERVSVLRKDIDALVSSTTSLMPENLHEQMSPADAANVIAFLRATFE